MAENETLPPFQALLERLDNGVGYEAIVRACKARMVAMGGQATEDLTDNRGVENYGVTLEEVCYREGWQPVKALHSYVMNHQALSKPQTFLYRGGDGLATRRYWPRGLAKKLKDRADQPLGKLRATILVAYDQNRVIGKGDSIPWDIPMDRARFAATTKNRAVIMGRRTWDSLPNSFSGRSMVVVTSKKTRRTLRSGWEKTPDLHLASTVVGAIRTVARIRPDLDEVFIIGGEGIYREALQFADIILATEVDGSRDGDTFFPCIGRQWVETGREDHDGFSFVDYCNTSRST